VSWAKSLLSLSVKNRVRLSNIAFDFYLINYLLGTNAGAKSVCFDLSLFNPPGDVDYDGKSETTSL
jgi:hypothetical protein